MAEIDQLLAELSRHDGSDLHLSAHLPPRFRVHGSMKPARPEIITPTDAHRMLLEIMPPLNRKEYEQTLDTDFAYALPGIARFRVNVFRDLYGTGGVFRRIPDQIPTAESLGLPDAARAFCELPNGIVLVTGPTGSGKSTTLAAMVDIINTKRLDHIITVEDPIEYVHASKGCLVNQREVRSHTTSFARALRAALREDPDVMLVGEMRDLETTRIAIEMAETGHLVFATLHTRTAASTVDRLIGQFPANEQEQIRMMTANSLRGVISQTLLRRKGSGRVAAFEVLVVTQAVQSNIREGKLHQIPSIMQISAKHGMNMLNDSLLRLILKGVVEVEEAMNRAYDRDDLQAKLKVAGVGGHGSTPTGSPVPLRTPFRDRR